MHVRACCRRFLYGWHPDKTRGLLASALRLRRQESPGLAPTCRFFLLLVQVHPAADESRLALTAPQGRWTPSPMCVSLSPVRSNDVWVLDLEQWAWSKPNVSGPSPHPRGGQSQVTLYLVPFGWRAVLVSGNSVPAIIWLPGRLWGRCFLLSPCLVLVLALRQDVAFPNPTVCEDARDH